MAGDYIHVQWTGSDSNPVSVEGVFLSSGVCVFFFSYAVRGQEMDEP
jgi:hypothetical protein